MAMKITRKASGIPAFVIGLAVVCFYLMFSPVWAPQIAPRQFDNARLFQLGLLVTIPFLCLARSAGDAVTREWIALGLPARVLIAVVLGAGALSAALSAAPKLGALEISLVLLSVLLLVFVAAALRRAGDRAQEVLAVALFAGGGLVVVQFWLTWGFYLAEDKHFSWVHPFLEFANVRFFSQYQAYALLPMLLPVFLFRLNGWRRGFILFVASAFWSMQWMVGTRSLWVGFVVAVCAVALLMRDGRRTWLAYQGVAVAVGGIIFLLYLGVLSAVPEANPTPHTLSLTERGWQSTNIRVLLAQSALAMLREHPLLGVGPGQFGVHYSLTRAAHPHNSPLQLLSEYGLVGGGAAVALLLLLVVLAIRAIRGSAGRPSDLVNVSLGGALLMGLVDSLFSGNLTMPHSQVMICVVSGWVLARRCAEPNVQADAPVNAHRFPLVVSGPAAAVLAVSLAMEYVAVVRTMPGWLQEWVPHFWQYGRFRNW
jgi:O-antigen ligase